MTKKLKHADRTGRYSVYIPPHLRDTWNEIENKSAFLQMALEDVVGIMTWNILKKADPKKYHRKLDDTPKSEVIPKFNEHFPLDPLTKTRIEKRWHKPSRTLHDALS